jgi:hypothetical protein
MNEELVKGKSKKSFDTSVFSEGIYLAKIHSGKSIQTKKINITH